MSLWFIIKRMKVLWQLPSSVCCPSIPYYIEHVHVPRLLCKIYNLYSVFFPPIFQGAKNASHLHSLNYTFSVRQTCALSPNEWELFIVRCALIISQAQQVHEMKFKDSQTCPRSKAVSPAHIHHSTPPPHHIQFFSPPQRINGINKSSPCRTCGSRLCSQCK